MSSENTKIIPMVYIEDVVHVRWTPAKGLMLKKLRGKESRRSLEVKVTEAGHPCTHENLRRLENGITTYISIDFIKAIVAALGVDIQVFVKIIYAPFDTTDNIGLPFEDGSSLQEENGQ